MPKLEVHYFAILREQRGIPSEHIDSNATTAEDLYNELKSEHNFTLSSSSLRAAVNDEFAPMDYRLKDGDVVTFISPVAGG